MSIKNGLMGDGIKFTPKMQMVNDERVRFLKAAQRRPHEFGHALS